MTSKTELRHNLYEPRIVSREGFRIEKAAGVAIENCLNEGVHPRGTVVTFVDILTGKQWQLVGLDFLKSRARSPINTDWEPRHGIW
jgi:hypothetical protein